MPESASGHQPTEASASETTGLPPKSLPVGPNPFSVLATSDAVEDEDLTRLQSHATSATSVLPFEDSLPLDYDHPPSTSALVAPPSIASPSAVPSTLTLKMTSATATFLSSAFATSTSLSAPPSTSTFTTPSSATTSPSLAPTTSTLSPAAAAAASTLPVMCITNPPSSATAYIPPSAAATTPSSSIATSTPPIMTIPLTSPAHNSEVPLPYPSGPSRAPFAGSEPS
ncbi:pectinesterase inhibitor 10-like [Macadamia integrifolia]|uniref:pectinesterase inhibitor 10-like n=1 Tax=Macadamia integrifolia TaxID=60698 RepID=UPI001C4EE87B|nr:pectinesterase inhibitor 10-like [Macadamia integrifolia]